MGLRSDIQTDMAEAFDTDLADAVKPITIMPKNAELGQFNPATGKVELNNPSKPPLQTRGVFSLFKETARNNESYEPNDLSLVILQNELSGIPEIDGRAISAEGEYTIIDVEKDPADAVWILQCRK